MPAMDAVITTAPRWPSPSGSFLAIAAAASRSTLYVPTRYRSIVLVNPPSVAGEPSFWTTFSAMPQPPCATTANRNGASCSASAIAASTLASSVTSVCTYLALGPSSAASLPARSSATSPKITDAPAPTSLRTVASPSPPAPPVTRTELPATSTISSPPVSGRAAAGRRCVHESTVLTAVRGSPGRPAVNQPGGEAHRLPRGPALPDRRTTHCVLLPLGLTATSD